jgi:MFS family permease
MSRAHQQPQDERLPVAAAGLCFLIVATDGIDVAIMGFLAPDITKEWGISRAAFGVVMSAAPIGLAIGAMLVGPMSDRYGRKKLLMTAVAWFGTFSLLSAFANDVVPVAAALPDRPRPGRGHAEHDHAAVGIRAGAQSRSRCWRSCSPALTWARPWSASAPPPCCRSTAGARC